jgi:hypothetical protein
MGIRHDIHDNLFDNPITWREFITLFRQRGKWFWRILYAVTALIIFSPVFFGWGQHYDDAVEFVSVFLIFLNIFVYPLVVVRSVMTANETVARERRGRTWDLLMLTGVSTWRVVFGKWLGTMRFIARDYVWLFVLRVSAFFWFLAADSYKEGIHDTLEVLGMHIYSKPFWVGLSFMLMFAVAEMLFSTALGIATAFFNWRTRTGGGLALGIRIGLAIALFFGTMYFVGYLRPYPNQPQYEDHVDNFIMAFALTFTDNGAITSARFVSESWMDEQSAEAIRTALWLNLLLYLILTGIALEVARTVANYVGINNAGKGHAKSKKKKSVDELPEGKSIGRTISVPAGITNVFELAKPTDYRGEVYYYQRRLGRMFLRLTRSSESLYIQLSNVTYIEAPSFWSGAAFRTATQSEYEAFVQEKDLSVNQFADKSMRLYVLEGEQPVRIVAGVARMLDDLPMDV